MTPRVSVVMPVHNGEAFLEEAVESVLHQTLRELELVAVDDGSTDGSPGILAAAAERDGRVRVLRRERGGVRAALNDGCAAAEAAYIARLDADDVALSDRLERQAALLDASPDVGLVGGAYVVIDASSARRSAVRCPTSDAELRARLHRYNVFAHPTVMFRREAFEQAGGYRLPEVEDYDLWLRISERWRLAALPDPVIAYRHHAGQASVANVGEQALCLLASRAAAERRRRGEPDPLVGVARVTPELLARLGVSPAEFAREVVDHHVRWATMLAEGGDRAAAEELLAQAAAPGAPYSRRELAAHVALGRAKESVRCRRPLRAMRLLAEALAAQPGTVASDARATLARRRRTGP